MVLVETMLESSYLMNTKSHIFKMFNLNMVSSNTMGFRVTMVDHMSLCNVG